MPVVPRNVFQPIDKHQSATITTAATLNPPAGATQLRMQATGQNIRYTLDGSEPTATLGFVLYAGDPMTTINLAPGTVVRVASEKLVLSGVLQYQWGIW